MQVLCFRRGAAKTKLDFDILGSEKIKKQVFINKYTVLIYFASKNDTLNREVG